MDRKSYLQEVGRLYAAAADLAEVIRKQRLVDADDRGARGVDAHVACLEVQRRLVVLGPCLHGMEDKMLPGHFTASGYIPPYDANLLPDECTAIAQGVSRLMSACDTLYSAGFGRSYQLGEKVPAAVSHSTMSKLEHGIQLLAGFASKTKQPEANGQPSGGTGRKTPKATVAARMLEAVQEDHTRAEWTAARWATYLGCSASAVVGTKTWTTYSTFRELARAKRAEKAYQKGLEVKVDKRRLPKRKKRRRSIED